MYTNVTMNKQLETWLHPLIIFTISCKLFMITVILFNFAFSLSLFLSLLLLFPTLLLLLLLFDIAKFLYIMLKNKLDIEIILIFVAKKTTHNVCRLATSSKMFSCKVCIEFPLSSLWEKNIKDSPLKYAMKNPSTP